MIKVYRDLAHLPFFKNAVVTIGTFDGVHTGHQQILQLLKQEAANTCGESVIITFYPHPRKIVASDMPGIKTLNTIEEKTLLLDKYGIENMVIIPFDEAFSQQTAEEYIGHFLFAKFHPATVIIGYDHRFGKDRSGDYHLLEDMGERFNYKVKEIPGHVLNKITVSSTQIRQALLQCDISTANHLLGYEYFFEGKVVEGRKIGRTLNYPTANLHIEDAEKLIPGDGIYAVKVNITGSDKMMEGMMSIGLNPTVDGKNRSIEINIFDFDTDIYGFVMKVYMVAFLRPEVKFENLQSLKEQLGKDEVNAREKLLTHIT